MTLHTQKQSEFVQNVSAGCGGMGSNQTLDASKMQDVSRTATRLNRGDVIKLQNRNVLLWASPLGALHRNLACDTMMTCV